MPGVLRRGSYEFEIEPPQAGDDSKVSGLSAALWIANSAGGAEEVLLDTGECDLTEYFGAGLIHAVLANERGSISVDGQVLNSATVAEAVGAVTGVGWWITEDAAVYAGSGEDGLFSAALDLSKLPRYPWIGRLASTALSLKARENMMVDVVDMLTSTMNNIGSHSEATRAVIALAVDDLESTYTVTVRAVDNGIGIPESVRRKKDAAPVFGRDQWLRARQRVIRRYEEFGGDVLKLATTALFPDETLGYLNASTTKVSFAGGGLWRLANGHSSDSASFTLGSLDATMRDPEPVVIAGNSGEQPVAISWPDTPPMAGTFVESVIIAGKPKERI